MFIAVEGCIGAGKSTVARGLAAHRGSRALLEAFELNPFFQSFVLDPPSYALETEFTFLLIHFHQLKSVIGEPAEVISDFHLGKDLLYEQLNISDVRTRKVFHDLYELSIPQIPKVDLMVCLSAPDDLILERIRLRHREFELKLDERYYVRLNALYEVFFNTYMGNKLIVRMDEADFVQSPGLFSHLSARIDSHLLGVARR
jgi:deoxyadenosine/deoxycytidine kinase